MKYVSLTLALVVLIGGGCATKPAPSDTGMVSNIPVAVDASCTKDADCVVTKKVYHPCSEVYAIAARVTDSEIEKINEQLYKVYEGRKYDCPVPQDVSDLSVRCQSSQCALVNNKYPTTKQ